MSGSPERLVEHRRALLYPVMPEHELIDLMRVIDVAARKYGREPILREGVAELIEGAATLLHGDWGRRLVLDELRATLYVTAKRIGYDIDTERFVDSRVADADFRLDLQQ